MVPFISSCIVECIADMSVEPIIAVIAVGSLGIIRPLPGI